MGCGFIFFDGIGILLWFARTDGHENHFAQRRFAAVGVAER